MHAMYKNSRALVVLFFKHQKVVRMRGRSIECDLLILHLHGQKFSSPINI